MGTRQCMISMASALTLDHIAQCCRLCWCCDVTTKGEDICIWMHGHCMPHDPASSHITYWPVMDLLTIRRLASDMTPVTSCGATSHTLAGARYRYDQYGHTFWPWIKQHSVVNWCCGNCAIWGWWLTYMWWRKINPDSHEQMIKELYHDFGQLPPLLVAISHVSTICISFHM